MTRIRDARFPRDAAEVLEIWREYVASVGVSLAFQRLDAEFADLPGSYARPHGRLLVAERDDGGIAGCVALRRVDAAVCEMKRLYVRPGARGGRLGARLVERAIGEARQAGYAEMRLDVLAEFEAARRLYASFGFVPADPVAFNPVPGATFLGLRLR